jgi:glutathione S-transferase
MDIELYYTPRTRSLRPRWLLEELDVSYRLRPVDLFGGERNPVHPLGSVPAIRVDGDIMFESGAICQWLADRFPEKRLAPEPAAAQRMAYEQWMYFVPGTLEPPAFDILLHSVILPEKRRVPEILPFASRRYQAALGAVDKALEGRSYILGEDFSAADIMLGSTLLWLPELLADHPGLPEYAARVSDRPAYRRAVSGKDSA